jgi:hypothetical protein
MSCLESPRAAQPFKALLAKLQVRKSADCILLISCTLSARGFPPHFVWGTFVLF